MLCHAHSISPNLCDSPYLFRTCLPSISCYPPFFSFSTSIICLLPNRTENCQFASNFPLFGAWMKCSEEGLNSLLALNLALHHIVDSLCDPIFYISVSVCHTPLCLSYFFIYSFLWTEIGSPSSLIPFWFITGVVIDPTIYIHFTLPVVPFRVSVGGGVQICNVVFIQKCACLLILTPLSHLSECSGYCEHMWGWTQGAWAHRKPLTREYLYVFA